MIRILQELATGLSKFFSFHMILRLKKYLQLVADVAARKALPGYAYVSAERDDFE